MTPSTSRIARVIDELVAERDHLVARLAKVDAAIATMRDLFHLPGEKPAKVSRSRQKSVEVGDSRQTHRPSTPAKVNGHSSIADKAKDAIRVALARGPLGPKDLAAKAGLTREKAKRYTAQLVTDGELISSGATASTRYALAHAPKEAPQ